MYHIILYLRTSMSNRMYPVLDLELCEDTVPKSQDARPTVDYTVPQIFVAQDVFDHGTIFSSRLNPDVRDTGRNSILQNTERDLEAASTQFYQKQDFTDHLWWSDNRKRGCFWSLKLGHLLNSRDSAQLCFLLYSGHAAST